MVLSQKIAEQELLLQTFASENNITSLERDENRALSQTKNLGANLDDALAEQAQAQALLNSLQASINDGQTIIRPADKAQIDATRLSLQELNANLAALSEKYTQAYLERDPAIVAQQQKAQQLQILLDEQINASREDYLLEVKRDLNTVEGKVAQLNSQVVEQNKLAQTFNQSLEQYKRLDDELKALQLQAQTLKNQQVAQEVAKPYQAKISLLEPAFLPDFAIGPNYQLHSLISLGIALTLSILALLLFSFIFRQKTSNAANNFVVIPGQSATSTDNYTTLGYSNNGQQLSHNPSALNTPAQLPPAPETIRLLSQQECQSLFSVANSQGKVLLGLVLNGVSHNELLSIRKNHFQADFSKLEITNTFKRQIDIHTGLVGPLQQMCDAQPDDQSIWININELHDLNQLLINVAHDAQLVFPEQLSLDVLRHTYLTFLASQGARLNDIEQIAGYTPPNELARYRHVNQQGSQIELSKIQVQYQFVASD
jgi:hypothetical protein